MAWCKLIPASLIQVSDPLRVVQVELHRIHLCKQAAAVRSAVVLEIIHSHHYQEARMAKLHTNTWISLAVLRQSSEEIQHCQLPMNAQERAERMNRPEFAIIISHWNCTQF